MIFLDIIGRCGNQMFQYAFARSLAEIRKDKIMINFSSLENYSESWGFGFCDELCGFRAVTHYCKDTGNPMDIKKYGDFSQKTVYYLYKRTRKLYGRMKKNTDSVDKFFRPFLAGVGIYTDTHIGLGRFNVLNQKHKNVFAHGYFEDPGYFADLIPLLRNEFSPLEESPRKNNTLLTRIKNEQSVCISFRRWEVGGRECCDEAYYINAVRYIIEHTTNPLFVIFSNDVQWVKNNFDLPENCVFEDGTDTIPEKIRLMSACKHFIMSNSTFSWWPAILGDSPDKIVISPAHWFEDKSHISPLVMKEFVKI